jgi:hypothetical protein
MRQQLCEVNSDRVSKPPVSRSLRSNLTRCLPLSDVVSEKASRPACRTICFSAGRRFKVGRPLNLGRHRPPRPGAARLLPALLRDAAARSGGEYGSAWTCLRIDPFPLPALRHAWDGEDPTARTAAGRGSVTLAFLWCNSCIWEIDQAQLDKPPWSGSRQRYRRPGCGRPVVWHIHGPAWRPGSNAEEAGGVGKP